MASMCSTVQSPRAENALASASAARTCPAPEDAESNKTRGLLFTMARAFVGRRISSSGGSGGHEFVTIEFWGDSRAPLWRWRKPHEFGATPQNPTPQGRKLAWAHEDGIDFAAPLVTSIPH